MYLQRFFDITSPGWSSRNSFSPFFWVPFLVCDLVNLILVLYKYRTRSSELREEANSLTAKTASIYDIVIRDNLIYFSAWVWKSKLKKGEINLSTAPLILIVWLWHIFLALFFGYVEMWYAIITNAKNRVSCFFSWGRWLVHIYFSQWDYPG